MVVVAIEVVVAVIMVVVVGIAGSTPYRTVVRLVSIRIKRYLFAAPMAYVFVVKLYWLSTKGPF